MFTMEPTPKISVCHVEEEDSDKEIPWQYSDDEINDSSEDDVGAPKHAFHIAQRARLTSGEQDRLSMLRPVGSGLGTVFVTRFTTTNLRRLDMVNVESFSASSTFKLLLTLVLCTVFMYRNYPST